MLSQKAYAKINLTLDVVGKRPDGYHLLETAMSSVSLFDIVSAEKSGDIILSCSAPGIPLDGKNTCYKSAELFFSHTGISGGAKIHIEKNIPSQAGLGGGSSDAAAVLRMLNELYGAQLSYGELEKLASYVGADVPFCIRGGAAVCRGIGEDLSMIRLEKRYVLLVKPRFGISTPEAYRSFDEKNLSSGRGTERFLEALSSGNDPYLKLSNDLEAAIDNGYISSLEEKLLKAGADSAQMTGSGSCVFGIFRSGDSAGNAIKRFENEGFVTLCETI